MLDTAQRYFFVPSSYEELKVTAGEKSSDGCAHVQVGGNNLKHCVDRGSRGGFWIVAMDRLSGAITDDYGLLTNADDAALARSQLSDLAYLLGVYYKSNDLIILTTIGTPIGNHAPVTQSLHDSVSALGGNAYHLGKLTNTTSSYMLISSPDPSYVNQHHALQSFVTAKDPNTGATHVLLAKNRSNRYVPAVGVQDQRLAQPFGFEWSRVLFQQPRDWPQWTPAKHKAYEDLTSSDDHYPSVRAALGCGGSGVCQPIRSYYVGGIGTVGTPPAVLSIPYSSLRYYADAGYELADFNAVRYELETEQGWARNAYTAYAQFTAISAGTQDNLQMQLSSVANSIEKSLYDSAPNSALTVQRLNQASAVASLVFVLPAIGPAAGAVGAALNAAAAFTPVGATPIPEQYSVTLAKLRSGTATLSGDMQASIVTAFAGVVQDYGKLSTIGAGIGSQHAPWYMCVSCYGSNVPLASVPMFALGGKQSFYEALLPAVYSSDVFVEKKTNDPKKYASWTRMYDGPGCYRPYYNAETAAYFSFPSIKKPSTWDVFIITSTKTGNYPGTPGLKTFSFPSQSLLDQMFTVPRFEGTSPEYRLTGGAGLAQDDFMPSTIGGYLSLRAGYMPGTHNDQCPAS
jgi:hypothetical protein